MDEPRTITKDLRRFDSAALDRQWQAGEQTVQSYWKRVARSRRVSLLGRKGNERRPRFTNSQHPNHRRCSENKMQALRSQREHGSTIATSNEDSAGGDQRGSNPQERSMTVDQRVVQNPTMKELEVRNSVVLQRLGQQNHGLQMLVGKDGAREHEVVSSAT